MRDRWVRPPSLRWVRHSGLPVRLIAAAMLGVVVASVTAGVAGTALLRGYLQEQARRELRSYATALVGGSFVSGPVFGRPGVEGQPAKGISVEIAGPGGQSLARAGPAAAPALPVSPSWIARNSGRLVTIPGAGGPGSWLVIAEDIHYTARHVMYAYGPEEYSLVISARQLPGQPGTVVVGMSLAGIGRATTRLAVADAVVTAVVLLLLAEAGAASLRASLRPLALIGAAAQAAVDGEVSRRAPVPGHGELAGLARSVNDALDQAQAAGADSPAVAAGRAAEEGMRRALADAAGAIRRSLAVIRGFSDRYRDGQRPTTASVDGMMSRVAAEADGMTAAADRLSQTAR